MTWLTVWYEGWVGVVCVCGGFGRFVGWDFSESAKGCGKFRTRPTEPVRSGAPRVWDTKPKATRAEAPGRTIPSAKWCTHADHMRTAPGTSRQHTDHEREPAFHAAYAAARESVIPQSTSSRRKPPPLPAFLAFPVLWSALHHVPDPLPHDNHINDDGNNHRDRASALQHRAARAVVRRLGRAPLTILRSARVELNPGVQGAMWAGVFGFLKDHSHTWMHAPEASPEFRTVFLVRACSGAAHSTVVVVVCTVLSSVLGFWIWILGEEPRRRRRVPSNRRRSSALAASLRMVRANATPSENESRAGAMIPQRVVEKV
ncbi:hypothetical protein B0H17DRAFT_1127028 [Mycena rosella]|uniref:Uncharacterized protein n=1 Tax=Mycena rosella TaxID=1033263 RepID=A0AAD7M6Y1_MYCRO|nr:hypothetical protein B0H17DRAFT_1127028 [Mycena rosella]